MGKKAGGGGRPGQSSPSQFGTSPWAQQGQGGPGDRQANMQQAMQQFQQAREGGQGQGQMGGRPNGGFDPNQFQAQAQQNAQQMRSRIDAQHQAQQMGNPGLAMQGNPQPPGPGGDKGGTPNSSSQANLSRASSMASALQNRGTQPNAQASAPGGGNGSQGLIR
jgi:hypothetical protein